MSRILTPLFAAMMITAGMQAAPGQRTVQSGPYTWTTGVYQYDAAGNIKAIGDWTFAYDPLARLQTSHMTADTSSNQTFVYDVFGNRISRSDDGIATDTATDPATNHLQQIAVYDDAGNLVQVQPPRVGHVYGYRFDALSMVAAETVDGTAVSSFVYTADDERLRIDNLASGTKEWRLRGVDQRVFRDVRLAGSNWTITHDYLYRNGSLLAAITPSTVEHFSLDHLGSPRLISDAVGNRISLHTYLPFGKELGVAAADGEPMKFTGHERDDDPAGGTNPLDYMHARFYPSELGRFLSVDPAAGSAAGGPQSWNRYAYVHNSPLGVIDPTGTTEQPMFVADGGSIWEMALANESHLLDDSGDGGDDQQQRSVDCTECILYGMTPDVNVTAKDPAPWMRPDPGLDYKIADAIGGVDFVAAMLTQKPTYLISSIEKQLNAAATLVMFGGGPKPLSVDISRWGSEIENGSWVMRGGPSRTNYVLSGKWQRGFGNEYAPFNRVWTKTVHSFEIRWSTGWGIDGWWKGIFNQRRLLSPLF